MVREGTEALVEAYKCKYEDKSVLSDRSRCDGNFLPLDDTREASPSASSEELGGSSAS